MRVTPEQYREIVAKRAPRNKFNAKKKVVNGLTFDSTREARRYQDLELMQQAGQITDLRRQVPFPITINGALVTVYNADFVYLKAGTEIVEDTKGHRTEIYNLKRKLVQACYGFKILET